MCGRFILYSPLVVRAPAIVAQDAEAAALYMRFHLARSRLRMIDARVDG
jgi:hypothetical protein